MSIGLKSGTVLLVPYSPEWAVLYAQEEHQVRSALGSNILDVQHVGSTALPGLVAKPIIDIGIAVENFERAAVCVDPMVEIDYEYRGESGIPRRHYFVKGRPSTHHVHMVEIASAEWLALVLFRDYLRAHPEVANKYAQLKHGLARKFATDRNAYQRAKASFITELIARAKQEGPSV